MNGTNQYGMGVIVCRSNHQTPPFQEKSYYQQLTQEGIPLGIHVMVFCPMDVDWQTRSVNGWRYNPNTGQWSSDRYPLPSLIYDRCGYSDSRQYQMYKPYVMSLSNDPNIQFLGRPLGGKLPNHEMLVKNSSLLPYLPQTLRLTAFKDVRSFIEQHDSVLIKPNGGSHGRGVAAILPHSKGYVVRGRSPKNQPFQIRLHKETSLRNWINRFTKGVRYVIQPFLHLDTSDRRPFDLRILVQKDGLGQWATTGMAVRLGSIGSLTSNIHGGGKAERAIPFVHEHFPQQANQILATLQFLSKEVPLQIEREHGRLIELGLDTGIDRQGQVWLLEANSKPGRSVFLLTGEKEIRIQSVRRPILYARSLAQGLIGGSV
ncbi:YheC/YheD family protein [Marininema halotolerans]|nr:YheC/YheD family protein [Marininema halotolerans]